MKKIRFDGDVRNRRLSVQERLMGPRDGIKAIRAAESSDNSSDGTIDDVELSDEANEIEKEREARSFYLRKRL